MKIFGPKSLSLYLFYFSRLFTILITLLIIFILISFVTENYALIDNRFEIKIPLMELYIKGIYQSNIITTISLTLFFYILFLFQLSKIFQTFKSEVLFTKKSIKQLKYFALFNVIGAPLAFVLIHFIIMQHSGFRDVPTYLLHIILGVFVLFIAIVFEKGYQVQAENDLTI
jgi:hypothetical protein